MWLLAIAVWVIFFWGVLSLAIPSDTMRRDPTGNGFYYLGWMIIVAGVVSLHYLVMAHMGHGRPALLLDGIVSVLFMLGHGIRIVIRRRLLRSLL